MGSEQMNDKKEVQTMWSESLLEHLYLALKKDKDDALLWEIIEELRAKDYDDDFLIKKVKQKVNTDAAVLPLYYLQGYSLLRSKFSLANQGKIIRRGIKFKNILVQ